MKINVTIITIYEVETNEFIVAELRKDEAESGSIAWDLARSSQGCLKSLQVKISKIKEKS